MRVNEIFTSIEGEGKRAGLPCTFIRLYGCNLNCSYCDTRYSCDNDEFDTVSIDQIMDVVRNHKVKAVTVTGGEPLIHPGIDKLLLVLAEEDFKVNVETNGSRSPLFRDFDFRTLGAHPAAIDNIFYTMDWKCKSSGMEDKMSIHRVNMLSNMDVLKFVVGSIEDMDGALSVIEQMKSQPQIFFSPVFGKIEPSTIVDYIQSKQLYDCKVQLQLHKFIWEPTKRGV